MNGANGIDAVFLRAERPVELARWYADHLGVGPESQTRPAFRTVPAASGDYGEAWSVSIAVAGLDAVLDQLRAEGIDISQPQQDSDGRYVTLRDPEGNPVLLRQRSRREGALSSSDEAAVRSLGAEADDDSDDAATIPARRRWAFWVPLALIVVVLIAVAVVIQHDTTPGGNSAAPGSPASTATSADRGDFSGSDTESPPGRVTDVGHPLFGITADWELVAVSPAVVVRLDFGAGRITTTELPWAGQDDPLSMVAAPGQVLVQRRGSTSAYMVTGRQRPKEVLLDTSPVAEVFPGPASGQIWVTRTRKAPLSNSITLKTVAGDDIGTVINYPADGFRTLVSDQRGGVLLQGIGDVYLATSEGIRRVAAGKLVAAGPTRLLVLRCDEHAQCSNVVVDRETGEQRALPGQPVRFAGPVGAISPDGTTAALVRPAQKYRSSVLLVDLSTGNTRQIAQMRAPYPGGTIAWSPNGRWLFATSLSQLVAFNTEAHRSHTLDVDLPALTYVTFRRDVAS